MTEIGENPGESNKRQVTKKVVQFVPKQGGAKQFIVSTDDANRKKVEGLWHDTSGQQTLQKVTDSSGISVVVPQKSDDTKAETAFITDFIAELSQVISGRFHLSEDDMTNLQAAISKFFTQDIEPEQLQILLKMGQEIDREPNHLRKAQLQTDCKQYMQGLVMEIVRKHMPKNCGAQNDAIQYFYSELEKAYSHKLSKEHKQLLEKYLEIQSPGIISAYESLDEGGREFIQARVESALTLLPSQVSPVSQSLKLNITQRKKKLTLPDLQTRRLEVQIPVEREEAHKKSMGTKRFKSPKHGVTKQLPINNTKTLNNKETRMQPGVHQEKGSLRRNTGMYDMVLKMQEEAAKKKKKNPRA